MKSFMSLFVALVLIFSNAILSGRVVVAQDNGPDPEQQLVAVANKAWDELAGFRARVEASFNVKLEKHNAWRTLKSVMPVTARNVESDFSLRWGVEITELDNGLVRITDKGTPWIKGKNKNGLWTGVGVVIRPLAPLTFIWFCIQMNMLADNAVETWIIEDHIAAGYTEEYARYHANNVTDELRYLVAPASAQLLNNIERIQERGADRQPPEHIRQPRHPRQFRAVGGDDPNGYFIGTPGPGQGEASGGCWARGSGTLNVVYDSEGNVISQECIPDGPLVPVPCN